MISPSHPRPCARLHVSGRAATSRPNPVRHTKLDKRLLHWWPPLVRPQARAHSSRPRRPLPARRQQGLLLCPSSWAPLTPSAAPARGAGIPLVSPSPDSLPTPRCGRKGENSFSSSVCHCTVLFSWSKTITEPEQGKTLGIIHRWWLPGVTGWGVFGQRGHSV